MSEKVRVVLSIDKETWDTFRENVKDYPRGLASWVVQRTFADINTKFEVLGGDRYIDEFWSRRK